MNFRILIGAIILITIPCGVFIILTVNTNKPIQVELVLRNDQENSLSISDKSMSELEKVIKDNMIINDQRAMIEMFNNEKSNYINLITILSVLLTVFSLFSIISSFVDKNETEKLSKEMNSKIIAYDKELKKIYCNTLLDFIHKEISGYKNDHVLLLEDNTKVNDNSTFIKAVDLKTNRIFEYINEKKINKSIMTKSFYINYLNYILATVNFGFRHKYIQSDKLDMNLNEAFRIIISKMFGFLKHEDFQKFKNVIDEIHPVTWGSY